MTNNTRVLVYIQSEVKKIKLFDYFSILEMLEEFFNFNNY